MNNKEVKLFNYKEELIKAKNMMDALPRGARSQCARDCGVYPSRVSRVLNDNVSDINGLLAIRAWLDKATRREVENET